MEVIVSNIYSKTIQFCNHDFIQKRLGGVLISKAQINAANLSAAREGFMKLIRTHLVTLTNKNKIRDFTGYLSWFKLTE